MVHNTTDYRSAAARTISLAVGNNGKNRVDPLLYSLVRVTNVHVSKVIQEQMDVVL